MATTYEPIATNTLGSAAASITFSSISSAYTDLKIVFVGTATAALYAKIQFNGDTAANYSYIGMYGDGTTAAAWSGSGVAFIAATPTFQTFTTTPTMFSTNVFSYGGSTYKSVLNSVSMDKSGSGISANNVGLWRNTAAITSITILTSTSTFAAGTIATLYGIKAA